jgi:hypothetical protein
MEFDLKTFLDGRMAKIERKFAILPNISIIRSFDLFCLIKDLFILHLNLPTEEIIFSTLWSEIEANICPQEVCIKQLKIYW